MPKYTKSIISGISAAFILLLVFGQVKKTNYLHKGTILKPTKEIYVESEIAEPLLKVVETTENNRQKEFEELVDYINNVPGIYSVYIENLNTSDKYIYNGDTQYYAASLYKIPIAIAVLHEVHTEKLSLEDPIIYLPADFSDGSGSIPRTAYYSTYTIEDLLTRLLKDSDNVAQVMLTRTVSPSSIQQAFDVSSTNPQEFYAHNISSIEDYVDVFHYLHLTSTGKINDTFIGKENALYLLDLMRDTAFEDRISLGLKNSDFAHKIGNWGDSGSWHDCGIAYASDPYIACVMSQDTTFEDVVEVSIRVGEFIEL